MDMVEGNDFNQNYYELLEDKEEDFSDNNTVRWANTVKHVRSDDIRESTEEEEWTEEVLEQ